MFAFFYLGFNFKLIMLIINAFINDLNKGQEG